MKKVNINDWFKDIDIDCHNRRSKEPKMEKMDNETIMCIEVAADFSGTKLPENYKNMTFDEFEAAIKFGSKEQEQEFMEYYCK